MSNRVEQLDKCYKKAHITIAGDYVFKCLKGFAEILDSTENVHSLDTDLVDIYMILGMANGTTIQVTGQLVDVVIFQPGNTVRIRTEDRKTRTMPDSTFIFSLNDVVTIQSLDIVSHQKRLEAKLAEEIGTEETCK